MDFATTADHRAKIKEKENEKIDDYLDLVWEVKKLWNMKMMVIPIVVGALGMALKDLEKNTGRTRNQRMNWDHPDYGTKISQNI